MPFHGEPYYRLCYSILRMVKFHREQVRGGNANFVTPVAHSAEQQVFPFAYIQIIHSQNYL